ncbi:MAG: HAD-IIIA family hydrolase [Candidatus Levybacteria bacterium]|nr:HAD-IIIA family hydrolase [Candidatus Levybacteria bacterium]
MIHFIEQIYRDSKNYKGIVFLDRDGTINKEAKYLQRENQIEILPSVTQGIRLLNQNNIAVIVITNQPVIAHGLITIEDLKHINDALVKMLLQKNAYIDAVYSCPHHPHADLLDFRVNCVCRKPEIAMHTAAITHYKNSQIRGVIGDQTRDIQAGYTIETKTVLVKTGYKGGDGKYDSIPNFTCNTFLEAVEFLLQ